MNRVIESKHTNHPLGQFVLLNCGWRTHTIVNVNDKPPISNLGPPTISKLTPELGGDLSPSLGLGIVGMPG